MKKQMILIIALGVAGYFIYKKFFATKPDNSGAARTTTATATATPTVPTPYSAPAQKAKTDKSTAQTATDYIGAGSSVFSSVKGLFGDSSNSTGASTPSTSGSGTASPLVYDSNNGNPSSNDGSDFGTFDDLMAEFGG